MRFHCLLLPLLALSAPALHAQAVDPLKTPECAAAIEALQTARAAAQPDARSVERLRHAAAKTCLGAGERRSRPARVAQPPIAIPLPPQRIAPSVSAPVPTPVHPPVAIDRPPVITSCDAAGCWVDNGGTHLQRVPPVLMGPGGLCPQAPGAPGCP